MKKVLLAAPVLLLVVLGVYHALMFYDNRFPVGRMRETPAIRPHEDPIPAMDEGAGAPPAMGPDHLLLGS